jgi:hypothetical protein
MIFNYININLKCKCCVLNEEIQGKFGENLWKIRQTTNEDFSLQEAGAALSFLMTFTRGYYACGHAPYQNNATDQQKLNLKRQSLDFRLVFCCQLINPIYTAY